MNNKKHIIEGNKNIFKTTSNMLCSRTMEGFLGIYSLFVIQYLRIKNNNAQDISYLIFIAFIPYIIGLFMKAIYVFRQPVINQTQKECKFINLYIDIKNGFISFANSFDTKKGCCIFMIFVIIVFSVFVFAILDIINIILMFFM